MGLDTSWLPYVGLWWLGVGVGLAGAILANINSAKTISPAVIVVTLVLGPLLLVLAMINTLRLRKAGV